MITLQNYYNVISCEQSTWVAHTRGYKFIFIRSHHMKEVEKNEIKRLSDRLDAIRHQQADLSLVEAADKYAELEKEKATLEAEIARLREVHSQKLSKEAQKLMKMPFQRAITKKEQADMGKLKKSVRGLVVVHPNDRAGP
ncbi:putative cytoplasmic protein [Escherichia coli]|nr:putative cytoplasmic protein [Escherichia coli]